MSWAPTLFVLFDELEYAPNANGRPVELDLVSWYGGAAKRLWILSKAEQSTRVERGAREREGRFEGQILYGRLIDPFWDAVVGVRLDKTRGERSRGRAQLALGIMGLAPYRFEFNSSLFVSAKGKLSARVESSYPLLLTQRLIAEPQFELNVSAQNAEEFGVSRGIYAYDTGVRVRYEFRREFAPYIGWSLVREDRSPKAENRLVLGLRAWR